jgi:hypothetical protein
MSLAGQTRAIAASAGNHGLGVALAAQSLRHRGHRARSRRQTPEVKRAGIAALGATVEVSAASYDEAEAEARRRAAADPGLTFVSPFDDDHVIAGNGGLLAARSWPSSPTSTPSSPPSAAAACAAAWASSWSPRGIARLGVEPRRTAP